MKVLNYIFAKVKIQIKTLLTKVESKNPFKSLIQKFYINPQQISSASLLIVMTKF